jgi:hypothetical protein
MKHLKSVKEVPTFSSLADEAAFWDNHSLAKASDAKPKRGLPVDLFGLPVFASSSSQSPLIHGQTKGKPKPRGKAVMVSQAVKP